MMTARRFFLMTKAMVMVAAAVLPVAPLGAAEDSKQKEEQQEEYYEPQNMRDACEFLLEKAIVCAEVIRVKLNKKTLTDEEVEKFFTLLHNYRIADVGYTYTVKDEVTLYDIKPSYKSCVRMLKAYRDPDSIKLTEDEKRALQKAKDVLKKIRNRLVEEGNNMVAEMGSANRWTNVTEGTISHTSMAGAIHDWLVANVEYDATFSSSKDGYSCYDGKYMFLERRGVCDAYAQAYWLLLQMAGVPSSMMNGSHVGTGVGHAWNLVLLDDHWAHVDATWDDPLPDKPERVERDYFDKDDAEMEVDHKWDKELSPNAKFDALFSSRNELVKFDTIREYTAYCEKLDSRENMDMSVVIRELIGEKKFDEKIQKACENAHLRGSVTCTQDPLFPQAIRIRYRVAK